MVVWILSTINFYLKLFENSAKKFELLHKLLRNNSKLIWTDEYDESFNLVKVYLCSTPVLAVFNSNKDVYIETDARFKGIGATLK